MQVQQAIVKSEASYPIRTYILLTFNIVGVLACLVVYILLTLTAMGIIFKEEDTSPVVLRYLAVFENSSYIRIDDDFYECLITRCSVLNKVLNEATRLQQNT